MNYQPIRWKSVLCKNVAGEPVAVNYPSEIDRMLNGELLYQIKSMPKQRPISFQSAINLIVEVQKDEWESGGFVRYPVFWNWHLKNFILWLTSHGYHIELAGDEFEPSVLS